ncbi:MAG: type IV secretion system DNA-binding domain-containing protein [Parcubacteria group bacterium]|nr:type IV secretion system DNA-binding domain-containing protein [Parcubacteria group bacterium]
MTGFSFTFAATDLYFAGGVLALLFLVGLILFLRSIRIRNMLPRSLNMVTLLIRAPREVKPVTEEAKKEEKEIVSVAEQMYANLHTTGIGRSKMFSWLWGRNHITFEIAALEGKISFYVTAPRRLKDLVEKQIHSQYPKASIEEQGDYNIFQPNYKTKGGYIKLAKRSFLPIKTYQKLESDPLNAIANSLSKVQEDEGAAVQILFRPAKASWVNKGRSAARKMKRGKKSIEEIQGGVVGGAIGTVVHATRPTAEKKEQGQSAHQMLTPETEETCKAIDEKVAKLGFEVLIRVIVSAATEEAAENHFRTISSSFTQYAAPNLNKFYTRLPKKKKRFSTNFIFRNFSPLMNRSILNTEELSSIFHLPTKFTETPNINWLLAKDAPPPPDMPKEGLLLGKSDYRGEEVQIRIQPDDRRRHSYVIGQTGTGKSVFLSNMIIQDIQAGKGLCVVDPHGDLVEDVLPHIPKERVDDIILFEPFDFERPMGLNMLEYKGEEQKDFAVQEMINIFYKLFPPEMIGPMFEHTMRNVMLTLMAEEENPGTIVEIPRILTDEDYQKTWMPKLKDPIVRAFWEKEMAKTSDFHKSEMLGYLVSKVGRFVENEMMRNIMGQSHSAFDLRDIMDNGKVLLVNLSKGKTGEVNSELLGLIIVSKIQMAAMARADMPEEERKDFYLYVDEFQNFATDSFASILAEARKYRLNLIVAHQYISQLEEEIRDAVFGNVGSFITFRIGVEDAEIVAKELDPIFSETDVINIEKFHAYLRLMTNSRKSMPFTMGTYPPPEGGSQEIAEAVRQLSRLKYGRDKSVVESEIMERAQLSSAPDTDLNAGMGSSK